MSEQLTRRQVLGMGAIAGASAVTTGFSGLVADKESGQKAGNFPWPWKTLDAVAVREQAYRNNFTGGCMYSSFATVARTVADMLGEPYAGFPFEMASYGSGGMAGFGSLCGACNGGAMAIAMFTTGAVRARLITELLTWYESADLPVYVPATPEKVTADYSMPQSKAGSILCHASIASWTKQSGCTAFSSERSERCSRLVADVAGKVVELLNMADNELPEHIGKTGSTASGCLTCHGRGAGAEGADEVLSKMNCSSCHPGIHDTQPL